MARISAAAPPSKGFFFLFLFLFLFFFFFRSASLSLSYGCEIVSNPFSTARNVAASMQQSRQTFLAVDDDVVDRLGDFGA